MEKSGGKNKRLIVILVTLAIVIVGLVVGIVVVNLNAANDMQERKQDSGNGDGYFVEAINNEDYKLNEEYIKLYNDGYKDESVLKYTEAMNKALGESNYDSYFQLLSGITKAMIMNGDCDSLMVFYDGLDESMLPPDERIYFYGTVIGSCAECNDTARQVLYEEKEQELYNNGGISNYEN